MMTHANQKYCCDKCADDDYNYYRLLKKKLEEKGHLGNDPALETSKTEPEDPVTPEPEKAELSIEQQLKEKAAIDQENLKKSFDKNISFLDSLTLHIEGSIVHAEDLLIRNFVFEAYSGQGRLYNIDPNIGCHFLQYNKYRLFRIEYDKFLIKKIQ